MLGTIPFAGITATGQSTAQGITTSNAQLVIPGATATPNTGSRVGDPGVKADPTNYRLIVGTPGIYAVHLELVGLAASALMLTARFRKNALTAGIFGRLMKSLWGTTASSAHFMQIVEITAADLPAAGGQSNFADPDATAGAGKPAGGFAGAGAAPKNGIPLDVVVLGSGSVNLTLSDIALTAFRVG